MSDLISRKALCEFCLNTKDRTVDVNDIMRFPSAEPERTAKVTLLTPDSKGYWSTNGRCQSCGFLLERKHAYCPNCGARLEWK